MAAACGVARWASAAASRWGRVGFRVGGRGWMVGPVSPIPGGSMPVWPGVIGCGGWGAGLGGMGVPPSTTVRGVRNLATDASPPPTAAVVADAAAASPSSPLALSVPTCMDGVPSRRAGSVSDVAAARGGPTAAKARSKWRVAAELSKARLSSLVVFTSGAGFLMAGPPESWLACAAAVVGTSLAAAAAGTFNQMWEVRTDSMMKRTQTRPLPAGQVSMPQAAVFGGSTAAIAAVTLLLGANPLTAALGVGNVALYSCIYTPLKQRSELNTAVGAIVGAIPPLMGWAAATGGLLAYEPMLLAAVLFWWQFPHFYSLGWTLRKDYARGGYAMVPVMDADGKRTAWLSLRSALALASVPIVATALGVTNPMFAVEGVVLNAVFLRHAVRFYRAPNDGHARALFRASLWYLPLLLGLMVFHSKHWAANRAEREVEAAAVAAPAALVAGEGDIVPTTVAPPYPSPSRQALNARDVSHLLARGMDELRDWGRAWCVHEVLVHEQYAQVRTGMHRIMCKLGQGTGARAPAAAASGAAATPASSLEEGGAASRDAARGHCPVIVLEQSASAVKDTLQQVQTPTTAPASVLAGTPR